jgi:hypothetical protein
MADPQISTTFIPQTQNPAPVNGGGLFGAPLEAFDGNRAKAKEYMCSFKCWWALNEEKPVFSIPYKRVAVCLSYMKGAKVEDWAEQQQEYMNKRKSTGRIAEFESHWKDFEKSFKDTFMNIAKHVKAKNNLKALKMTGSNIDSYIATFTKLMKIAGYKENKHGALSLFRKGLPDGLNIWIIDNNDPVSDTLKGWQESARQQQLKYLQTQEFSGKNKMNPYAAALAKKLRARTHQNHRNSNAMDIDAGCFTPLTDEEKQKL